MPKFLPFVLAAALLSALPASGFAATQIANSATSKFCSADAPDSYKRPGGYCDQIDDTNSLFTPNEAACGSVADAGFRYDDIQGRLLVAEPMPIDPCCRFGFNMTEQLPVNGTLVASLCPP